MSRPQTHRKSQSTSALSFLASPTHPATSSSSSSSSSSRTPSRSKMDQDVTSKAHYPSRSRSRQSLLPPIHEPQYPSSMTASASMATLPGLTSPRKSSKHSAEGSEEHATKQPGQAQPQRSSRSKSHSAAEVIKREKAAAETMRRERSDEGLDNWLSDLRSLRSSSRRRLSALKNAERYLLETCIDQSHLSMQDLLSKQVHNVLLSLLTRHTTTLSQRSSHTSLPARDEVAFSLIPEIEVISSILQGLCCISRKCKETMGEGWVMEMFIDLLLLLRSQPPIDESANSKAIAYIILEMLFCVLVDSPNNARTYEKLGGLEAVVRVLKGTGVTKDVRMKCIEFLYFYLLPEQNEPQRAVSSASSSSSSSSNESTLFPPSPLSTSQNSIGLPKIAPDGRSPSPSSLHPRGLADLDLPFVPMTPRKAPQPNLGYLTPATRKSSVCTSASSTPGLPTVPASPRLPISQSTTSRGLAAMLDEMDTSDCPTPRSNRSNKVVSDEEKSEVGLGLGLPRIQSDRSTTMTTFIDPFNAATTSERSYSGSSGSSTIVPIPHSRTISRSSTQPSLTITDTNGLPRSPSTSSGMSTTRRSSIRRVSKSPLIQSNVPESPEKGRTKLSESPGPRPAKIRHSRTQSHLSGLSSSRKSSIPPVPPLPANSEQMARTPSNKVRAFPAELTRGIPPSASSPSLANGMTPLGPSKRVVSDKQKISFSLRKERPLDEKKKKTPGDVKSVEEKKEMLGMWLGNVDQLVQGVEKVSFWGSIRNGSKGGD
uniref:Cell division control protein 14 n=1 Tax=Kwoniella dejecticola CBS 10117 TaxID=1296121 RepID=A0A1A5ZWM2_9TREE|nr:uncharacterized protein I303_06965 [Kwoniella dejecticola CBS 10117]OBR82206.1 hypothetical protein I303_06965 [Kwoniella dejecticola CBS 10117]